MVQEKLKINTLKEKNIGKRVNPFFNMLKKIVILFIIFVSYIFAFDTRLYDKFYPIQKFNLEDNKSLIIFFNETINSEIEFDNNYILDQFSFDYICSNPYFKEDIDSNKSQAIVILYDKFKIIFYVALINNCNDINKLISRQLLINNNNELFINIDNFLIFINEKNYIKPLFKIERYIDLCENDELLYILNNENIDYIINIDVIENKTLANITLLERCIN